MAEKGLRPHARVTSTQRHDIKEVPETTQKALERVETFSTHRATTQAIGPHELENIGAGGGNRTDGSR
jgi:hypothetical protein